MAHYVPEEILIEILLRLPVKSLIRFTSVSKSWQALIKSSNFVSKHLSNVQNQKSGIPSILFLRSYDANEKKEHCTLHIDSEDSIRKASEVNFPIKPRSKEGFFRIVGCCNGLVCLSEDEFGTFPIKPIILFNPSIQKSLVLPLPTIPPRSRNYVLGFGCDLQKYDLKVLRIVYGDDRNTNPGVSAEAEVYSLSKRSWGRVKPFDPHCSKPSGTSVPAFYNGAVHWIVFSYKSIRNWIMCFDFKDEKFSEIELPVVLAAGYPVNFCVTVHGDGLAIIEYFYNDLMKYCGVWVMEEYGVVGSWKKLYNIELVIRMDEVIGFRKHGELLVTMLVDEPLPYDLRRAVMVSYDPKSRQIKDLGIFGWVRSLYVHNYIETLVLLEDQNGAAVCVAAQVSPRKSLRAQVSPRKSLRAKTKPLKLADYA